MTSNHKDTAIFGLELQARALVPVGKPESLGLQQSSGGEDFVHRFAVATASARGGNTISLLEYQEGRKVAECSAVWNHSQEVLKLRVSQRIDGCSSATAHYLVATIHPASSSSSSSSSSTNASSPENNKNLFLSGTREISFFDLPDSEDEGLHELRPITTLSIDAVDVHFVVAVNDVLVEARVVARNGDIYRIRFDEAFGTAEVVDDAPITPEFATCLSSSSSSSTNSKNNSNVVVTAVCWNRDNVCVMGVSSSMTAIASDLVKVELSPPSSSTSTITTTTSLIAKHAHIGSIRVIVNSLGRLHTVLSGGDDGIVKGWEILSSSSSSSSSSCLFTAHAHHHQVYDISVNEDQPELFLTCGSDRCTKMWRVASLSAVHSPSPSSNTSINSPTTTATENDKQENDVSSDHEKMAVKNSSSQQQQHHHCDSAVPTLVSTMRDSVCSVCWSGTWVHSSCSFEGNVFVDQVPFEMRSQLLLSA